MKRDYTSKDFEKSYLSMSEEGAKYTQSVLNQKFLEGFCLGYNEACKLNNNSNFEVDRLTNEDNLQRLISTIDPNERLPKNCPLNNEEYPIVQHFAQGQYLIGLVEGYDKGTIHCGCTPNNIDNEYPQLNYFI